MDAEVLRTAMKGVQREITERHWKINGLISLFFGDEKTFLKAPKNKVHLINSALKMHREIKKLQIIKAELNLVYHLKNYRHELHHQAKGLDYRWIEKTFREARGKTSKSRIDSRFKHRVG